MISMWMIALLVFVSLVLFGGLIVSIIQFLLWVLVGAIALMFTASAAVVVGGCHLVWLMFKKS